ncbi:MAG: RHS repeat-associated core domain-containing protein [Kiritimatiellae bacterium]|nr:RHS repeat-associated core domain-containing protein [Kiritimatiellia bacterium]
MRVYLERMSSRCAIEKRAADLRRGSGGRCMRRPRGWRVARSLKSEVGSRENARVLSPRRLFLTQSRRGAEDAEVCLKKRTGKVPAGLISIENVLSAPMPSLDGSPVPIPVGLHGREFSFGFSTKYHDREVGLIAYQLRSYSPRLGRWLNRDPIEEKGGVNLYGFVDNMPSGLFDLSGMHSFKFVDLGWSYANILSGNIVDMLGTPITDHIGVTPYFLIAESRCLCESGKYVPDYTFKLLVYSLIQDSNDPVWTNNAYGTKIDDPRVKNKWNSFWFFTVRRRINLVLEHEERHRKHARESYDDIIAALKVKEEFLMREECEKWAKEKIKSAKWLYEMIEKEKAANVEKGRR